MTEFPLSVLETFYHNYTMNYTNKSLPELVLHAMIIKENVKPLLSSCIPSLNHDTLGELPVYTFNFSHSCLFSFKLPQLRTQESSLTAVADQLWIGGMGGVEEGMLGWRESKKRHGGEERRSDSGGGGGREGDVKRCGGEEAWEGEM